MKAEQVIGNLIRRVAPEALIETRSFESGAMDMDIRLGKRFIVVQCLADGRVGVSEIKGGDAETGHNEECPHLEAAKDYIDALLRK